MNKIELRPNRLEPNPVQEAEAIEMDPMVLPAEDQLKSSLASARPQEKSKSFYESAKEFFKTIRGFFACLLWHPTVDLYKACIEGYLWTLRGLLFLGKHKDWTNEKNNKVLLDAYEKGQFDAVKLMVQKGVRPNPKNDEGYPQWTVLHRAIADKNVDFAVDLIKMGIDIDDGRYMRFACSLGQMTVVQALIDRGMRLSHEALTSAIMNRHHNVAVLLIQSGIDLVQVGGDTKNTFLHYASRQGMTEIVDALLERGLDVNAKNIYGETPLHSALKGEQEAIALKLLANEAGNSADESGETPLEIAYEAGYDSIVAKLLQNGAPNNLRLLAAKKGDLAMVKSILGEGTFDLEVFNQAVAWSQWDVAAYLYPLAIRDKVATNLTPDEFAILATILTDPVNKKMEPQLFLMTAVKKGTLKTVQMLISRGANAKVFHQKTGLSLLHVAAALGHVEIVKELIENGIAADVRGKKYQETPLHVASEKGQDAVAGYLVFQHYWDKPEMLNARDSQGRTALHRAATFGYVDIATKLIEAQGIDLKVPNNEGKTAFDVAKREVADLILKKEPTPAAKQAPTSRFANFLKKLT